MDKENNSQKRQRGENWLEADKKLLQDLIKERVHVIECKNTDTFTNNKKKLAWNTIQANFNNLCTGGHRTISQLKAQWSLQKMSKKKEISEKRKKKTGGGLPAPDSHTSGDDIDSWLPGEFETEDNKYDCDTVCQANYFTNEVIQDVELEKNIEIIPIEDYQKESECYMDQGVVNEVEVIQYIECQESPDSVKIVDQMLAQSNSKTASSSKQSVNKEKKKKRKLVFDVEEKSCALKNIEAIADAEIQSKAKLTELKFGNALKKAEVLAAKLRNENLVTENLLLEQALLKEKIKKFSQSNGEELATLD